MNTTIQMMFPSIPRMILNKSDTSCSNSNLHNFRLNFEIESRKPAAEVIQLSHCLEGRLHVQCGDFWKGLNLYRTNAPIPFKSATGERTKTFKCPVHSCNVEA